MTSVIYNNIPATDAVDVPWALLGLASIILFRADCWGTTKVTVSSYSLSDTPIPPKLYSIPDTPVGENFDLCIECVGAGQGYIFNVLTPDVLTQRLFVEILSPQIT